jgi:hypothetical protein
MPYNAADMPMHEGRMLPSFSLREVDLPQVRRWEVGGRYYLIIEVEMLGKNSMKDYEAPESGRDKIEGYFRMNSVKELPPKEANKESKRAFEGAIAKARGGKR